MNGYRGKEYWDMVRISNEDKEYPSNMGKKWSEDEETSLLKELTTDMDIAIIAQKHGRTVGGINARCKQIAYKMYLKNFPIEEIIKQTKLDYDCIQQEIQQKKINNSKKMKTKEADNAFTSINKNDYMQLQNDVKKIKNDINEMKNTLGELVEMMKAVYEFENA